MASYVGLAFTPRLIVEIEAVLMQDRPEYSSFHCEVFCESTCFLREMIEALVPDSLESSYEEGAYALIDKLHSFDVDKSGGHRCAEMLSGDGEKELPSPEGEADELISQFLFEGDEFLSNIRSALTSLLQNNQQVDLAEDVYRQVHSFKGNCSLMNYPDLERLSVAMELALGLYKSGAYLIEKKLLKCCLAQMADLQAGLGKMKKGHEPTIDKLEKKIKKINSSIPSSHIKKQHLYSFSSIVETEKSVVDVEHHSEESSLLKDFTICVVEDSVLSRKKIKSLL
jgi:HPt (histidine-containing phosphotransfer) domain-containing protein